MIKDKSWLLEKHRECVQSPKTGEKMLDEGYELALNDMLVYINQLDEPETLSQEWIDENVVEGDFRGYQEFWYGRFIEEEKVRNLLVPEQDNGFVVFEKDKLDEEVQRMIDKTYKEMNEKPVIPQFMADWIEENECLSLVYIGFKLFSNRIKDKDVNDWISNNQEQFCRAFLAWPNVEVEKEQKYIIKFAPSVFGTPTYGSIGTQSGKKIMQSVYGSQEGMIVPNQYTRREIEEVGSKYMAFAEEVTE